MKTFQRWMVIPAVMVLIGLAGTISKLLYGDHVLGTTAAIPWGMLIAGYVFFAATATGVGLIAGLGHVTDIPAFTALEKRGSFLALSLLLAGFWLIGIELGNPLNMIYIILSPNLQSGIWWMGFLYSLYMGSLVLECYYSQVKPEYLHFKYINILAIINKIAAICNLGAIFAVVANRPFWYGYFLPAYMLVTAVLSGAAVLIVMVYAINRAQNSILTEEIIPMLGKVLVFSLVATFIMDIWKLYSGLNASDHALREATAALINGPLAWRFWIAEIGVGFVLPFILVVMLKPNIKRVTAAAGMILSGIFFIRIDFILTAQIVPQIVVDGIQSIAVHHYSASLVEWALVIGASGMSFLLYGLSEHRFNLKNEISRNPAPGPTYQG